jgi:hypothetical protein
MRWPASTSRIWRSIFLGDTSRTASNELTFLISVFWIEFCFTIDADRDVGITAQVSFLLVGFGNTQPAQQLAQANEVLGTSSAVPDLVR